MNNEKKKMEVSTDTKGRQGFTSLINKAWGLTLDAKAQWEENKTEAQERGRIKAQAQARREFEIAASVGGVVVPEDAAKMLEMKKSFIADYAEKHENLKSVGGHAQRHIDPNAEPKEMDRDILALVRDKAEKTSNEEMQELVGQILAGTYNVPGSFSKKTIELVSLLSKRDLESFRALCSFIAMLGNPVVLDESASVYSDKGVTYDSLDNLEDLGLVRHKGTVVVLSRSYAKEELSTPTLITFPAGEYFGDNITLLVPLGQDVSRGRVVFTSAGHQLSRICKGEKVPGFLKYLEEEYGKEGVRMIVHPKKQEGQGMD